MAIQLSKGQGINLTKDTGLRKALVGLGWDVNYNGIYDFDLDVSLFLTNEHGKTTKDQNFVFYNNLISPCGSVEHTGDNRTGEGDGDDEQVKIDFTKIPSDVHQIVVAVTIHDADKRQQNFGQVTSAFVRLENLETGEEMLRYDLSEDFSFETSVIVARIVREGNEWTFKAVGAGQHGGLAELCRQHGLTVA